MRKSSGTKRRRRKERRFRESFDILSSRTAIVAALAAFGFLMMQVGRSYLPAPAETNAFERISASWSGGQTGVGRP